MGRAVRPFQAKTGRSRYVHGTQVADVLDVAAIAENSDISKIKNLDAGFVVQF
jgi:hypothetical protein